MRGALRKVSDLHLAEKAKEPQFFSRRDSGDGKTVRGGTADTRVCGRTDDAHSSGTFFCDELHGQFMQRCGIVISFSHKVLEQILHRVLSKVVIS